MPDPRPAPENPTHGLTPIFGDHEVVVTGEEHHQPAVQAYAPRADGRARHVAVELVPAPITRGVHAGERGVEVRLDGRRIGELTARMSERYGPLVDDVLRRGGRPSCIALVRYGKRGLEAVLQLPDLRPGAPAGPRPPAVPMSAVPMSAVPMSAGPAPGPYGAPTAVMPGQAPRSRRPAPQRPGGRGPAPAGPGRRRSRAPLWIGGGVVALLVVIGVNTGGGDPAVAPANDTLAAAPTSSIAPTPTPTPGPTPTAAPTAPNGAARPVPQPQPQLQPQSPSQSPPQPRSEPTQEREPELAPKIAAKESSGCNANYSGCVPTARDVDCEGGGGDGPAYVSGPVRVTGKDVYRLDDDKDGEACE